MFPSQKSTCRAGSEIGKTPGATHAGPGALPARPLGWPRGQRAPTRPGRRPPLSSCSSGKITAGQAWDNTDADFSGGREPRAEEHRALPPPRQVLERVKNMRHSGV